MSTEELRRNAILTKLPRVEFDRLRQRLEVVDAELRQQLYEPRQLITEVYFPLSAVFSLLAVADDDRVRVEVATIGGEGMLGLPLFLGAATSPTSRFAKFLDRPPDSARTISGEP